MSAHVHVCIYMCYPFHLMPVHSVCLVAQARKNANQALVATEHSHVRLVARGDSQRLRESPSGGAHVFRYFSRNIYV